MSDTDAISDSAQRAPDNDQLRPDDPDVVATPPASDVQQVRIDALRLISRETAQARPPKAWEFLGMSDTARQMQVEPPELVTLLRREFCDDQLVMSRILVRRRNELQLNGVFGRRSEKFLMKVDAQGRPTDAFSARGTLSVAGPAVLPFALARRLPSAAPQPEAVLAATTDDDLLVLCRLGYTCVSAAGLSKLSGRVVEAILADPNAPRPHYRFELAIVVGSIAECRSTPSEEVRKILSHLQQIEPVYGRRPYDVFIVCWPDEAALGKIRAALTFRHRNGLKLVFDEALKSSLMGLCHAWDRLAQPKDAGLVEAHRRVRDALACDDPIRQLLLLRQTLPDLKRHMAAATVDKCWQAAQMASDPITSALYLECADVLQKTNAENPLIVAAEKVSGLASNTRGRELTVVDQRPRIDTLIKIQRALRQISAGRACGTHEPRSVR